MTLEQIIQELNLKLLTTAKDFSQMTPTAGYASDMLSRVMARAPRDGGLWVTLQSHTNIVAVGAVLGLSAIIITEGEIPEQETIAKANEMNITLLATDKPTFYVAGNLWRLGLRDD
jgi:predicted transcriptional regulator